MNPLLRISNISKKYTSKSGITTALNDVSFSIYSGEIFGLLGVNGAGKTTLSSILATLHPPTSGSITFNNEPIYNDITTYRKNLGFCPQKPNLDLELTVQENLIFAGRYCGMSTQDAFHRAHTLIAEFELEAYSDSYVNELSGGTKQRLLIARALVHKPALIILDEPTVGLDPDIRKKLWEQIKKLRAKNVSVILTTHYLDEAEELSNRICLLHKGHVQLIERVDKLRAQHKGQNLETIFLELVAQYRAERGE